MKRIDLPITFATSENRGMKPETTLPVPTSTVVFFKKSGKYYDEEKIPFPRRDYLLVRDAFEVALFDALYMKEAKRYRFSGMRAVCMDPNHQHAHPQMIDLPEEVASIVMPHPNSYLGVIYASLADDPDVGISKTGILTDFLVNRRDRVLNAEPESKHAPQIVDDALKILIGRNMAVENDGFYHRRWR